jgi:NADH:ubiquinone reductase (H+-translocating)
LVKELECEHDRGQRIITNDYLEGCDGVYAVGDCASITDPHTGKPYQPTAQHAIRQAKVAAKNIINSVKRGKASNDSNREKFDYKTNGMMAEIGKRTGVATLFGMKVRGFAAWWLWRT